MTCLSSGSVGARWHEYQLPQYARIGVHHNTKKCAFAFTGGSQEIHIA